MEDTMHTNEEVQEEVAPVEGVPEEAVEETVAEVVPVDPDFEDRSLYNCDNCDGSGLVRHEGAHRDELCPQCNGKGKLN